MKLFWELKRVTLQWMAYGVWSGCKTCGRRLDLGLVSDSAL